MSRRWLWLLVIPIAAVFSRLGPAQSPEGAVRAVVRDVLSGAEAADVAIIIGHLHPSFRVVSDGQAIDLETLRPLLARQFMRRGPISVIVPDIVVTVGGTHATAAFDALLTESRGTPWEPLPVDATGWHVELNLVLDPEWRITHAEREVIGGG